MLYICTIRNTEKHRQMTYQEEINTRVKFAKQDIRSYKKSGGGFMVNTIHGVIDIEMDGKEMIVRSEGTVIFSSSDTSEQVFFIASAYTVA